MQNCPGKKQRHTVLQSTRQRIRETLQKCIYRKQVLTVLQSISQQLWRLSRAPETPDDVHTLRRLGSDTFEATLKSGAVWRGDSELLRTLPQGEAKLATLTVRELMGQPKANAKAGAKAAAATAGNDAHAPPAAKKQRTLAESAEQREIGATEHMDGVDVDGTATGSELFPCDHDMILSLIHI